MATPCSNATALAALRSLERDVVSVFGPPGELVTDRVPYVSELFSQWCVSFGIEHSPLPTGQPEWNGQVERFNGTMRAALNKACAGDYSEWDVHVPGILFGYRARVHSSTGYSPYFVVFGCSPRLPVDSAEGPPGNLDARMVELEHVPGLRESLSRVAKTSSVIPQFEVGSFVLCATLKLRKRLMRDKKLPRYEGPYQIIRKYPHHLYDVVDERGNNRTFHVARLVAFVPRYMSPGGLRLGGGVSDSVPVRCFMSEE